MDQRRYAAPVHVPGEEDDLPFDLTIEARSGPPGPDPSNEGDDGDEGDDASDDCRPLDEDKEQVGFELFDWHAEELDLLDDELHELGIPHEWVSDGMEVVVHEEDEATLDALLPKIRFPDELPAEDDDGDDTDVEVLSLLFVSADRVAVHPAGDGVQDFLDAADRVADAPYGVEATQWERVTAAVDALVDALHAGADLEQVAGAAAALRDTVRPLV